MFCGSRYDGDVSSLTLSVLVCAYAIIQASAQLRDEHGRSMTVHGDS